MNARKIIFANKGAESKGDHVEVMT